MKILVCISKTPDTTAKVAFTEENTVYDTAGVQFIMNPYDEWYALVRALELKEALGGSVTVLHVGDAGNDTVIRKALAIGADDAIRVNKTAVDALDVATQIAAVYKSEGYDLILTGKETIDYNGSQVGAMLAELLDLHFVSYATHLDVADEKATVTRDIEGGEEIIRLALPVVISASKGLAEQRIPNMRGIMMAKRKPLKVVEPVAFEALQDIAQFTLPAQRTSCHLVDPEDMDTLVQLLHEEAKVI